MSSFESNPYAAPLAPAIPPPMPYAVPQVPYFRDGKLLVVRDGTALPMVCIRTNQPVTEKDWRKTKTLIWTPPWVYALIIVNLLIAAIVATIIQKKAKVTYSLGREARASINKKVGICLLMLFGAVGAIVVAFVQSNSGDSSFGALIITAVVLLIGSLVMMILTNPIKVSGYRDGWFQVKGCSPEFLDSIHS